MPVVGGYLAFIGYFCLEAGIGLAVSKSMSTLADWAYLKDPKTLLLAIPALLTGLLLTWLSRNASNDATLPVVMVAIPCLFYFVIAVTGSGLDGARDAGWVGETAPPVPISDLFSLVDMSLVQWSLIADILPTWIGMVLVVSFASCLDVVSGFCLSFEVPMSPYTPLFTYSLRCSLRLQFQWTWGKRWTQIKSLSLSVLAI
jgi:MFS superfamily sulfate permease-like transporter